MGNQAKHTLEFSWNIKPYVNHFLPLALLSLAWLRGGKGQAATGVPPEDNQPGDQGDLSGAVQRLQGGSAPGVHYEGTRGQEDRQIKRSKQNP